MKFTLNWLKDYLETSASLEEITTTLTALGLEVESVTDRAALLAPFRLARIVEAEQHPNADKLRVCKVDTGSEVLQIVCGAANARAGINVVLAPEGAIIPTNGMKIKRSKIRDVESCGMLCSAEELGLSDSSEGIIELPADASVLGTSYVKHAGLDDPVIEIAITPNRGDCLGVYGIARDLAAAGLGALKPLKTPAIKVASKEKASVTLEKGSACQAFIARRFSKVKNGESPAWLKTRLEAIGLRPISVLVDITNYIAFSFARPLHVYDNAKLQGGLRVRLSHKGEELVALNGKTYTLPEGLTVIADEKNVQALGGVIGGELSGCDESTTEVVLEVALFEAEAVAKAGRTLEILTDSRYRFERKVDAGFMQQGEALAAAMILELCGGEAGEAVCVGAVPAAAQSIAFDATEVKRRGGVDLPEKRVQEILSALGFTLKGREVGVPSWRPDVTESADLVEEVLRVHGYDHIPSTPLPPVAEAFRPVLSDRQKRKKAITQNLAARGLSEVVSWSFLSSQTAKLYGEVQDGLKLKNPISSDLDTMRPSILPNLVDALVRNYARGQSDLGLFELGPVFNAPTPGGEYVVAAGVRGGQVRTRNPHEPVRAADVFDAKADALSALAAAGAPVASLKIEREAPAYYHPGKSGALKLGKTVLAYFGELHPLVLKAQDAGFPVAAFEVRVEEVPQPKAKKGKTRSRLDICDYQASTRDFAFVVDASLPVEELVQAIRNADKKLITDAFVFDVYQGKGLEENKKSVAVSIRLQASDRTLTEADLEGASAQVIAQVKERCQGVLR